MAWMDQGNGKTQSWKIYSKFYRNIRSAEIKPNASKLIGQYFFMQQDNDPKHTVRATKGFLMTLKDADNCLF